MSKQWVRQQIRRDEMKDGLEVLVGWISDNRQKAAAIGGGVVAVVLAAGIVVYQVRASRAAAWERLSVAQTYAYSGKPDTALEQVKQLAEQQPNTSAAGYATVFSGDILYQRGQYKEAAGQFSKVIERGNPKALQPVALSGLTLSQESENDYAQAIITAERFLEAYPDHYLAPQVHSSLARSLLATSKTDLAKATLQKIQLQYAGTYWAAWAQAQMKMYPPANQ